MYNLLVKSPQSMIYNCQILEVDLRNLPFWDPKKAWLHYIILTFQRAVWNKRPRVPKRQRGGFCPILSEKNGGPMRIESWTAVFRENSLGIPHYLQMIQEFRNITRWLGVGWVCSRGITERFFTSTCFILENGAIFCFPRDPIILSEDDWDVQWPSEQSSWLPVTFSEGEPGSLGFVQRHILKGYLRGMMA